MANKKPKASKSKVDKPKNAAKSAGKTKPEIVDEEVVEIEDVDEVEAVETEAEVSGKKDKSDHDAKKSKSEKKAKAEESKAMSCSCIDEQKWLKGFFSRKYETKESILTIFKNRKFYGALLGELIGTAFLTLLLFVLSLMGIHSMATYSFAVIAIFIAIYAFSGACLNPIITVGMMASRRMSVIRGTMYIIAEILGAWLGWLIFNSFHLAGGDAAYDIPAMAAVAEGQFWILALLELTGAVIIAFFYARALKYKRSVFTFGATVAGGMILAIVLGYVVSAAFFNLSSNFIFNPATALMFQIFPSAGENFGEILGGICQALSIYAIFPMIGGAIGFCLSDFTARLSGEEY